MEGLQTELSTELEGNAKCALAMHSLSNLILCNGLRTGAAHTRYQVLLFEKGTGTLKPAWSD